MSRTKYRAERYIKYVNAGSTTKNAKLLSVTGINETIWIGKLLSTRLSLGC